MATLINKNIIKINKPKAGWSIDGLEKCGFRFWYNKNIQHNWRKVLEILNNNLPYFYIFSALEEIQENGLTKYYEVKEIIIDDEFVNNIQIESKKSINYFSKSIFEYAHFVKYTLKSAWDEKQGLLEKKLQEQEIKEKEKQQIKEDLYKKYIELKNNSYNLANYTQGGIYSIFKVKQNQKELLYIGLSERPLHVRWNEHLDIIIGVKPVPPEMKKIYKILKDSFNDKETELIFEPLLDFSTIKANRPLSKSDKESMELAFITFFQPNGNASGIDVPYYFSDAKE